MNDSLQMANVVYDRLLSLTTAGKTPEEQDCLMEALDMLVQTVLFAAAIEDELYLEEESEFLVRIVRKGDVMDAYNHHLGGGLKKLVTWQNVIFLPRQGKRQLLEALEAETLARIRGTFGPDEATDKERLHLLLKILEIFVSMDAEQRGDLVAQSGLAAGQQELMRLYGQAR